MSDTAQKERFEVNANRNSQIQVWVRLSFRSAYYSHFNILQHYPMSREIQIRLQYLQFGKHEFIADILNHFLKHNVGNNLPGMEHGGAVRNIYVIAYNY